MAVGGGHGHQPRRPGGQLPFRRFKSADRWSSEALVSVAGATCRPAESSTARWKQWGTRLLGTTSPPPPFYSRLHRTPLQRGFGSAPQGIAQYQPEPTDSNPFIDARHNPGSPVADAGHNDFPALRRRSAAKAPADTVKGKTVYNGWPFGVLHTRCGKALPRRAVIFRKLDGLSRGPRLSMDCVHQRQRGAAWKRGSNAARNLSPAYVDANAIKGAVTGFRHDHEDGCGGDGTEIGWTAVSVGNSIEVCGLECGFQSVSRGHRSSFSSYVFFPESCALFMHHCPPLWGVGLRGIFVFFFFFFSNGKFRPV